MRTNTANKNRGTWTALASKLAPVCIAITSLVAFSCLALNEWRHGVTIESWRKVTARVVDRRRVEVSSADGTGSHYQTEIDVSYNIGAQFIKRLLVD